MPDDRDTQTAAPSTDGDDNDNQATATAVQDPPETDAEAGDAQSEVAATPDAAAATGDAQVESMKEGGDGESTGDELASPEQAADETGTAEAKASEQIDEEEAPSEAETADVEARRDPEPAPETLDAQIEADAASDDGATETRAHAAGDSPDDAETPPTVQDEAAPEPQTEAKTDEGEGVADQAPLAGQSASESEDDASATAKAEEKPAAEAQAEQKSETKAADQADAKAETKADGSETKDDQASKPEAGAKEAKPDKATKPDAGAKEAKPDAEAKDAKAGDKKPELDDPTLKELRKAKEDGTTVTGKVIGWNRGGFHVVIDEVTAFCPASEMELGRPRSPETYMDREMDFKVAKFQRKGRRVVLTRSDLLKGQREEILAGLKPGTVTKGVVTSLPDFGAFIDLGGVEGLVHVSEISRSRVKHPRDVLQSAQEVEVKVLSIEKGGDRISLSMKELEPDPWKDVADKYPRGSEFEGKILRHADFGMFVELEPDVEGLVHVSQLAPGSDMKDDELQPGKTLNGWVREVDTKRGRISLSMREVPDEDPWKSVTKTLPEGEMVEGTVESIAPFGVFINLRPGLTGLLPNSHTGLPRGTNPNRAFTPGSTVSVQVLAVDPRRKRISLGREGSRVEATKADLQEFKKLQKEREPNAPSAMEAAFARLGLGGDEGGGEDAES